MCGLDRGRSRYLRCPYHGWTFDTAGSLVALPAEDGFGAAFDRAEHGLVAVPRAGSYRGFIFASWSADGPTLADHLGRSCEMIDRLCDLSPVGEIELRAGWLRHRVRANWKIAAENVCDFYHPPITHASSGLTTDVPAGFFSDSSGGVTRDLGNGHGEVDYRPAQVGAPARALEDHQGSKRRHLDLLVERDGPAGAVARLRAGPPHGFIFPNLFIAEQNVFVIEPVSVGELSHRQTPVSWVGLPDEVNRRHLRRFEGGFGPAGMVEPDDSAVWERLQLGLEAGEPEWAILQRGSDRDASGEGRLLDETALRGFWRHYRSLMTDSSGPGDVSGIDDVLEQHRIEQFLFREARLIDERRFTEWEQLWDDDGIYWVPANGDGTDPDRDVSLIYDNRSRLHSRVERYAGGKAFSQQPPPRTAHLVTNVVIDADRCTERSKRPPAGGALDRAGGRVPARLPHRLGGLDHPPPRRARRRTADRVQEGGPRRQRPGADHPRLPALMQLRDGPDRPVRS